LKEFGKYRVVNWETLGTPGINKKRFWKKKVKTTLDLEEKKKDPIPKKEKWNLAKKRKSKEKGNKDLPPRIRKKVQ